MLKNIKIWDSIVYDNWFKIEYIKVENISDKKTTDWEVLKFVNWKYLIWSTLRKPTNRENMFKVFKWIEK